MASFDPNEAPPVAPDHPFASKYCALVSLVQEHQIGKDGARLFLPMLDDTEFMLSVFRWIVPVISANKLLGYQKEWREAGYRLLLQRSFAVLPKSQAGICKTCLRCGDLSMLTSCLEGLEQSECMKLFRSSLKNSDDIDVDGLIYLARRFQKEIPESKNVVERFGSRVTDLKTWQVISELYSIRVTREMVVEMTAEMILDSYHRGLLQSHVVLEEVLSWIDPFSGSNIDLDDLSERIDALRTILRSHQFALSYELVRTVADKEESVFDQGTILVKLLDDVHVEDDWIFWKIVGLVAEEGNRNIIRERIDLVNWMQQTYEIDLFTRGEAIFGICPELYLSFHELSQNCETQFWYDRDRICVASRVPLAIENCHAYQIDYLYLYSERISFCVRRSRFIDEENYCLLGISRPFGLEESEEPLSAAESSEIDLDFDSSSEEPRPVPLRSPRPASSEASIDHESASNEESEDEGLLVDVIDLANPEVTYRAPLPGFLIPMAESMAKRAKSARK